MTITVRTKVGYNMNHLGYVKIVSKASVAERYSQHTDRKRPIRVYDFLYFISLKHNDNAKSYVAFMWFNG